MSFHELERIKLLSQADPFVKLIKNQVLYIILLCHVFSAALGTSSSYTCNQSPHHTNNKNPLTNPECAIDDVFLPPPPLPDFSIPIHPIHLRFVWQGQAYEFTCLPFGLRSAPQTFMKLMRLVMGFLWERGVHCVIYLDDILILDARKKLLLEHMVLTVTVLDSLGFQVNLGKWEHAPPWYRFAPPWI